MCDNLQSKIDVKSSQRFGKQDSHVPMWHFQFRHRSDATGGPYNYHKDTPKVL